MFRSKQGKGNGLTMANSSSGAVSGETFAASGLFRRAGLWVGVAPFFVFVTFFMLLPSSSLVRASLFTEDGLPTLEYISALTRPDVLNAYALSIEVSAGTAIAGGIIGFFLAYAVTSRGIPRFIRPVLMTFSGVASNFAGVPLAFAFQAALGRVGDITVFLRNLPTIDFNFLNIPVHIPLQINLYAMGFTIYGLAGLSLTYLYFQFPLMVLVMAPALEGLKREWREASQNLGASTFQYWRFVGLPILLPSLLGTMLLLFGNAFGAYATAFALAGGGNLPLITLKIFSQLSGDVTHNVGLGYAMALGMVVVMAITITGYSWLQRRAERWLR